MTSQLNTRRLPKVAIATLAVGLIGLTAACGTSKEQPSTTTTTTTTTSSVAPSPTEKGINPTGGNKFTPTVKAPTPATAIPGDN